MFNLELTIALPLFLFFLSQLPPPIWDCRSFCFSQILSPLTFLLTWHTSIAISWVSAELSEILLICSHRSHHRHTHCLEALTQISHSWSILILEIDIEIITSKAYNSNTYPNQVLVSEVPQNFQFETHWLLARNSNFWSFTLFSLLNIWDKPTKKPSFSLICHF